MGDGRDDMDTTEYVEPETTEYVEPTATTERPAFLFVEMDTKCPMGAERSFKLNYNGEDNCAARCEADEGCMYFSIDAAETLCIGCDVAPTDAGAGWTTYEVNSGRRALSELEALRIENARLRAHLN